MLELEGQIKIEEMCFYPFLEDGKDSAAGIELGRSFHQMGTVNEEVSESDFVPLCRSTIKILSTYLTQEEVLQYVNEAIRLILCPGPVVLWRVFVWQLYRTLQTRFVLSLLMWSATSVLRFILDYWKHSFFTRIFGLPVFSLSFWFAFTINIHVQQWPVCHQFEQTAAPCPYLQSH